MERSELFVFLAITLGIAAFLDLRSRRIPNWLNLSIIVASVTFYIVTRGFEGLLFSVEGMFVGLGIMLVPYLMGGMGAGDAKLMAAVGSILGPKGVIVAILYTVIIGGIYAIILLLWHGQFKETFIRYKTTLFSFFYTKKLVYIAPSADAGKPLLCYGLAIALGTLISVCFPLI